MVNTMKQRYVVDAAFDTHREVMLSARWNDSNYAIFNHSGIKRIPFSLMRAEDPRSQKYETDFGSRKGVVAGAVLMLGLKKLWAILVLVQEMPDDVLG